MIAPNSGRTVSQPSYRVGDERPVKLTPNAAKKVNSLLAKQGRPNGVLRVARHWWRLLRDAIQDGPTGPAGAADILVESAGIKVVVDPKSALYVTGSELIT